jgi:hypothetical protein
VRQCMPLGLFHGQTGSVNLTALRADF